MEPTGSPREAIDGADLICVTTSSPTPVVRGAWLADGVHLNAVGACLPTNRELDSNAVARSRVFVDRLESAMHEAGDFLARFDANSASTLASLLGAVASYAAGGRKALQDNNSVIAKALLQQLP